MPKVVIQAGHQNIKYNVDPGLRTGTGAPGEASFTVDIANQVSAELRKRGVDVKQTDANANADPDVTTVDWNLFLAIHYDADSYGTGGGFVGIPDASIDGAHDQSLSLANALAKEYFGLTGVHFYPQRQNPNTFYYYMWHTLSLATPCVLIECGVGQHHPDDYDLLQNNRSKVVEGIVRGICAGLGLVYDIPPSPLPQPTNPAPTSPQNGSNSSSEAQDEVLAALKQLVFAIKKWLGF